jgi:DNA-binding MarR family transcriptional regulator
MASGSGLGREVTGALGYLLKHAHVQLDALTTRALEPFGIDPRGLGVLRVLASREPTSQQEIAQLLSVDRTTMVALLDALERKGIVLRRPSVGDRRRNVVELTPAGLEMFGNAQASAMKVEQEFLTPVGSQDATRLREALHLIVTAGTASSTGDRLRPNSPTADRE